MLDKQMEKIQLEYWKHDPLIISAIKLIKVNYDCDYTDMRITMFCNSNSCILFGVCDRKNWDIKKIVRKRMMKRIGCSKEQLEQFLFEALL